MSRRIETLDELHSYILRLLKYVDEVCRENNITYFLSGGTALGAVRHKGFIPWDDDADIMFPRPDYERFLKVMAEKQAAGQCGVFRVDSVTTRNDWTFPFARIWDTSTRVIYHNLDEAPTGIFVDIFPMDGLPDSMLRTKLHYAVIKLHYVCLFARIRKRFKPGEPFVVLKKILAASVRKVKPWKICVNVDKLGRRCDFNSANYVGCTVLQHYMSRERFEHKHFQHGVYVDFEDTQLPIPNGYDAYLTALYGDYMTPPSESEQNSGGHQMDIFVD